MARRRSWSLDTFSAASLGDLTLESRLRDHVEYVLALCDGNLSQAAQLLGLHRRTLQRIFRRLSRSDRARYHKQRR